MNTQNIAHWHKDTDTATIEAIEYNNDKNNVEYTFDNGCDASVLICWCCFIIVMEDMDDMMKAVNVI